jgi:hypothetical protein
MKNILVVFCLMSISASSFAMHAYGEDSCIAQMINGQTLEIGISNGEPANPHKIINRDNSSDELTFVEFRGAPVGGNEKNEELVLKSKGDRNIIKRKTDDGCFRGFESTSTRQATVVSVSKKLAEQYGLSKDTLLNFVCFTSSSSPSGNNCK